MDKKQELETSLNQCIRCKDLAMDKADEEIAKLRQKIADAEVTYSIGDRFKGDISGNELLLVGSYQEGLKAGLAYLYDGEIVCKMVGVSDLRAITQTEMAEILSKRDIKRTFNYRKQVNV